jgi:hypothetical protein
MGRKKKDEEILDDELDLASEEAELELELDDADDSDEEELKEPATLEADSLDEETAKEPKAPRKRSPRKTKAEPAAEETVAAAVASPTPAPTPTPIPAPAPAPVVEKDAVVLQWEAAKQTTEAIVASLEKVNGLLRELPDHYAVVLQKSMKASAPRSGSASKIAFGTSLMAILLSVLSLSFSQSARQAALSHDGALPAVQRAAPERNRIESAQSKQGEIDMLAALENVKTAKAKKAKRTK